MIDRHGQKVNIGWAEHEDLWLEAANTLDRLERHSALRDIAAMTGRKYEYVLARAARMRAQERRQAEAAYLQRQPLRAPVKPRPDYVASSTIAPPSRERLMAGR